jgi:hypothetical protein
MPGDEGGEGGLVVVADKSVEQFGVGGLVCIRPIHQGADVKQEPLGVH